MPVVAGICQSGAPMFPEPVTQGCLGKNVCGGWGGGGGGGGGGVPVMTIIIAGH